MLLLPPHLNPSPTPPPPPALPPTHQTDDLARMFRLFSRIPRGLDPVADAFREHVEGEGMRLVRAVAEAVEAKREKDAGVSQCVHRPLCCCCLPVCVYAGSTAACVCKPRQLHNPLSFWHNETTLCHRGW